MNSRAQSASRSPREPKRRGTALYITVLSTALIVSLLGLTGISIVRIERRLATSATDRLIARSNARSAVELALQATSSDATWRTKYTSGIETAQLVLGPESAGTVSFALADSDGSLSDGDTELMIKGIGRAGDAIQVSRVQAGPAWAGPVLFNQNSTMSSFEYVNAGTWWAQYVKPDLPADAIEWKVTSVEFFVGKSGGSKETLLVKLYVPDASNMPATEVDGVAVAESTLTSGGEWVPFRFSSHSGLDPTKGVCVSMECLTSSPTAFFHFRTSGDTDPRSDMIRGSLAGGWTTYEPGAALLYRLHGTYKSASVLAPISGTWTYDGY